MKRKWMITLVALAIALGLAPTSAGDERGGFHNAVEYGSTGFKSLGPGSLRGVAHVAVRRDGSTRTRAYLLGAPLPGNQSARLALSRRGCARLDDADAGQTGGDWVFAAKPLVVDGTSNTLMMNAANAFKPGQLRRARTLAVAGDFDGDGSPEFAACGRLDKFRGTRLGGSDPVPERFFATAAQLGSSFDRARFLAQGLTETSGIFHLAGGGLDANRKYRLGVSRRRCAEVSELLGGGGDAQLVTEVAGFRTDRNGTVLLGIDVVTAPLRAMARARSMFIFSPGQGEPALESCGRSVSLTYSQIEY